MCNCLKEVSKKLEDHLKAKIKPEKVHSFDRIGFDNECFMLGGNSLGTAIGLPFHVEYFAKKKDGSRARNATKVKTNLFMSYCPMCGKKYPETQGK
jgi:hypothetical protein